MISTFPEIAPEKIETENMMKETEVKDLINVSRSRECLVYRKHRQLFIVQTYFYLN